MRTLFESHIEPDRRVERRHLVQQDVGQLGLERVAVLDGREVPARAAPVGDRARHTTDHLLDGVLAQRRVELAAEVLLGDDVRRVLRPRLRKLDAALLEGDAVAVGDAGIAQFPLDGVERLDAGLREEPGNGQRLACLDVGHEWGLRSALHRPAPLISPRGFVLFAACRLRSGGRRFLRLASDGTRVRRAAGRLLHSTARDPENRLPAGEKPPTERGPHETRPPGVQQRQTIARSSHGSASRRQGGRRHRRHEGHRPGGHAHAAAGGRARRRELAHAHAGVRRARPRRRTATCCTSQPTSQTPPRPPRSSPAPSSTSAAWTSSSTTPAARRPARSSPASASST